MRKILEIQLALWMFFYLLLAPVLLLAEEDANTSLAESSRQYTYSWLFSEAEKMKPRGGATQGPMIELDSSISDRFTKLQAPGILRKERDRRAILAMEGDYRTSFDFIETIGFTENYQPTRPYQSWGTERVYLLAAEEDFISLQHIIVMHFVSGDGTLSEPMVVKHWRQDWRYEDPAVHDFQGRGQFKQRVISPAERKGTWSQTVFQVDDSPRYEAIGRWVHAPGVSFWESDDRRRPLPRRETSIRDDYQALYGSHRITITPDGWTQEEDALKLVLDKKNMPITALPYLARETGLSRYERILNYDFSAGDQYWDATREFWGMVRNYWDELYEKRDDFLLNSSIDNKPMFMVLFAMAEEKFESKAVMTEAIEEALSSYVSY